MNKYGKFQLRSFQFKKGGEIHFSSNNIILKSYNNVLQINGQILSQNDHFKEQTGKL